MAGVIVSIAKVGEGRRELKRKAVSGIMLTLLFIGMLTLAFEIQPVMASGTIYIRADGSVEPSGAPISSVDNVTYTFTADIYESIVVEKDNIVADGDGYTVQGMGSGYGIDLPGRSNVTVKNMNIKAFWYGVLLYYSSNNNIYGNNITNEYDGIVLSSSSNNSISRNNITNNHWGIFLYESSCSTISGNNIANNDVGIDVLSSSNNSISGNKITANNDVGIELHFSSNYNSIIENNITANNGYGIELYESSNNSITGNNLTNNGVGIMLAESWSNNISGNNIIANSENGIELWSSLDNTISENNIANNGVGINFRGSSNNKIFHNSLVNNARQVYDYSWENPEYPLLSTNVWDDGYPSGGNYWSDYTGVDEKSGPNQDHQGSDGMGDTPYTIDANNRDRYPFMKPWTGQDMLFVSLEAPTFLQPGQSSLLNATVVNVGTRNASDVELSLLINGTIVSSTTVPFLQIGSSYTLNYNWTPTIEGKYNATAQVPTLPEEEIIETNQATKFITVDASAPTTIHDYDGLWHTADFTINLTASDNLSAVVGTYYKINGGPTKNVTAHEQPNITTESANNTLEYWSIDKAGNEELPHKILTEIKLDKTAPTGSITINNDCACTTSTSVTLNLTATDATSGVYQVRYSNDGVWDTEPWETPSLTKAWTLTSGDGTKTVYVQFMNNAGLTSSIYQDTIALDTTKPTANAGLDHTVNEDTPVTFDGSASQDENGIQSYTWTFTDVTPQTLTGVNPTHTFTTPGTYIITLKVTDLAGNSATDTVIVTVLDVTPPIANAGQNQTVHVGATVSSDAGGSTDNVGIVSYEWDFGDGTTGTGITTTHTYANAGTYTVTLTVKDAAGNTATHSITITVEAPPAEAFPMWIVGAAAAIAAVGIAIATTILWKKRKQTSL